MFASWCAQSPAHAHTELRLALPARRLPALCAEPDRATPVQRGKRANERAGGRVRRRKARASGEQLARARGRARGRAPQKSTRGTKAKSGRSAQSFGGRRPEPKESAKVQHCGAVRVAVRSARRAGDGHHHAPHHNRLEAADLLPSHIARVQQAADGAVDDGGRGDAGDLLHVEELEQVVGGQQLRDARAVKPGLEPSLTSYASWLVGATNTLSVASKHSSSPASAGRSNSRRIDALATARSETCTACVKPAGTTSVLRAPRARGRACRHQQRCLRR